MTIGEKIKYLRKHRKITQEKLAKLTGIHITTIARYEINATQPKNAQVNRITKALNVSPYVISEMENTIRFETLGDFYGILILLIKNKLIIIDGERNKDGAYISETVSFKINPLLSYFFSTDKINADDLSYHLKRNDILNEILNWEKNYNKYYELIVKYKDNKDKTPLIEYKDSLERVELELQMYSFPLTDIPDIIVKNPQISS